MLEKQQVISDLRREFPQFLRRLGRWEDDQTQRFSMPVFAHFVIDQLYEHDNDERVRAAFAQMEKFLRDGSQEVRNLVGLGFLGTLHNLASWKSYGSEAFVRFLGPETRRVWAGLEAVWRASVKLDLSDRTTLEAEVLLWRIVRQGLAD
jgi:signal transduction histidine kinase